MSEAKAQGLEYHHVALWRITTKGALAFDGI